MDRVLASEADDRSSNLRGGTFWKKVMLMHGFFIWLLLFTGQASIIASTWRELDISPLSLKFIRAVEISPFDTQYIVCYTSLRCITPRTGVFYNNSCLTHS